MSWTDDRVEALSRLWLEGRSASQIAAALGGGLTRNAVIGKVHRLGLAGRVKTAPPTRSADDGAAGVRGEAVAAAPRRAAPRPSHGAVAHTRVVQGNTALALAEMTEESRSSRGRRKTSWWRCRSG